MTKTTVIAASLLALILSSCAKEDGEISLLRAENIKLKKELVLSRTKFKTDKRVKFVSGTTPVPWADYKGWVRRFQRAYYYSNSPVYYSSFLLEKDGLNMFLSSNSVKYLHVLWGKDPAGSNAETMIIRGIGENGTVYYLNENDEPDTQGENVLQHCLPCPPCADEVFQLPEDEYDFRN